MANVHDSPACASVLTFRRLLHRIPSQVTGTDSRNPPAWTGQPGSTLRSPLIGLSRSGWIAPCCLPINVTGSC